MTDKPILPLLPIPGGIDDLSKRMTKPEYSSDTESEENIDMNVSGATFRYTCEFCGKGMNSERRYQRHVASHAPPQAKQKTFACSFCSQVFATKNDFDDHDCKPDIGKQHEVNDRFEDERHANGQFVCSVCGKQFNQRYHLQTHMAAHTGNKPFQCMICGKSFARKDVLGVHMKVHSDVKEFQCEVCGARFKQRYHLTRHMNTHLERVDVVCDFCGQVFHRLDRYNQHIKRVHIGKQDEVM